MNNYGEKGSKNETSYLEDSFHRLLITCCIDYKYANEFP